MKLQVLVLLCAAVVFTSAGYIQKAPLLASDSLTKIKDSYIVVMKEELSDEEFEGHKTTVRSAMRLKGNYSSIEHEYHIGKSFRGYSIVADAEMMEVLRGMNGVKYIEYNQEVHALECKTQEKAEWGLFRSCNCNPDDQDQHYIYDDQYQGQDVDVYIIDTGIYSKHEDFEDRIGEGESFVNGEDSTEDGNGHGTHVAGTVMGNTYGIAKKATAIPVKVLGANGSGTTNGVIQGIDYAAKQGQGRKSLANMSLGGGFSSSINDAVEAAVKGFGVIFVVAAGNDNRDACSYSPASAKFAISVGSIDTLLTTSKSKKFERSYFSNYGQCVEIFAPGAAIESAWIGDESATNTISGTSMASPHVAGVVAKLLSQGVTGHDDVLEQLLTDACEEMVDDPRGDNLMLHNNLHPDKKIC